MTPIVLIVMVVFIAMLPWLFRGSFDVDADRVADVMPLEEREAIRDPALLVKCGVVLVAVFTAFVAHPVLHIEPAVVALLGAGLLILISRLEHPRLPGQRRVGDAAVLRRAVHHGRCPGEDRGRRPSLARAATQATGGNELLTVMLILGVSAPVSGSSTTFPTSRR